jgi:hypothetical protein
MFLGTAVALPVILLAQSKGAAPAIDDAAIVGIFDIANTWDIATGSLAATKGTRQDVKDLAPCWRVITRLCGTQAAP